MKDSRKNIAIVCGGDSSEHDVSLRSAHGLYSFFDKERYNVYVVDMKGLDWHVDLPDGTTAKINRNDFSFVMGGSTVFFDYAYITIHGTPGENGVLQGYFDLINMPYSTSGVLVEAMTFNKFVLNQYLRGYGVLVADSLLIRSGYEEIVSDDEVERRIGMPCFVKPAADGSSFGITKVKDKDQLAPAIRKAMLESPEVMVEACISGTEISVGCYKTRERSVVLPATEVVTKNEFFDYDAKYNGASRELCPAPVPQLQKALVQDAAVKIYQRLGCTGMVRMDFILGPDDKPYFLEVNPNPGMTSASLVPQMVREAGMTMEDFMTGLMDRTDCREL